MPFAADAAARKDRFTPEERSYWAFQPVASPKVPSVRDSRWVRNPIDAFILSQLEAKGLRPSSPADRVTLLRRVTLDLVGLPPTPDEVEAFLKGFVARGLREGRRPAPAVPALWRAWARHWLDLARYAESDGFKADEIAPERLALPRLRDPVVQRGQAVRPVRHASKLPATSLWPGDPDALMATASIATIRREQRRETCAAASGDPERHDRHSGRASSSA